MKTARIKFFSNYATSDMLGKRFKMNYEMLDNDLEIVSSNNYDYAVVFNGINEIIRPKKKIITIIQEPSWSPLVWNGDFLAKSDVVILHDKSLFEKTYNIVFKGTVFETASYMFYHDKVDFRFYKNDLKFDKTRKLSIVMSNVNYGIANYSARLKLLRQLLISDLDLDIYGRGLNLADRRYKGEIDYKHRALAPYEYSIAIENSNEYNYISEKFFDCVLCNTIPIYNGAPNISDVYDDRYFKLIDIDSPSILADIRKIIAVPAPYSSVNKDIYFKKFNLYTMLKKVIFEIT